MNDFELTVPALYRKSAKFLDLWCHEQWQIQGGPLWTKLFLTSCSFLLRGILDLLLMRGGLSRRGEKVLAWNMKWRCLILKKSTSYKTCAIRQNQVPHGLCYKSQIRFYSLILKPPKLNIYEGFQTPASPYTWMFFYNHM